MHIRHRTVLFHGRTKRVEGPQFEFTPSTLSSPPPQRRLANSSRHTRRPRAPYARKRQSGEKVVINFEEELVRLTIRITMDHELHPSFH